MKKETGWPMETILMYIIGITALFFIATGAYLHFLRRRAENVAPAMLLNPAGKRKRRKKR